MNLKILVCFALLLGACTNTTGKYTYTASSYGLAPAKETPVLPPAVLSATVIECLYGQGCHPVSP